MSKLDKAYSSIEKKDGHWLATIYVDVRQFAFRFRHEGRWFNLLHVLWHSVFGRRPGSGSYTGLSRACDAPLCVNPYHFRDQTDRQQSEWRMSILDLEQYGFPESDPNAMRIVEISHQANHQTETDLGLTHDFGCYQCEKRFDPKVARNMVICNDCWTDEDEEMKVRSDEEV